MLAVASCVAQKQYKSPLDNPAIIMAPTGMAVSTVDLQNNAPLVGAEVFIEPGQSDGYIDSLFATLAHHHMRLTRIRLFENFMRSPNGTWDFSLFDKAYVAAEKHGISIWGNFFPATGFEDVGGFKFPRTREHLDSVADFIKNCVQHFRQYKCHAGWNLLNEIGSAKVPTSPLSLERYQAWLEANAYKPEPGRLRGFGFEEQRFLLSHNTWYLQWLAEQVRRYDPAAHLHVNNHAIFQLVGEYDFPSWRSTLSSFGGSAHASWHFGYFNRNRYSYAVAANSAILHSGAGPKPWLMTELQGGNNTYSGYDAMCPTKEEIIQWLWTVVGSGGKGAIFWSLNPRAGGYEAGEWAMLDFRNQPSDRLKAAGVVAKTIQQHASLFALAKPLKPVVHLLYTRSSLWTEAKLQPGGGSLEGRRAGAVMKSILGYYETLLEMGIPTAIQAWEEFDFTNADFTGQVMVLAHQLALPEDAAVRLEHFVRNGGALIVDGLTGFYNEHAVAYSLIGNPLRNLLGGGVLEYKVEGEKVPLVLNSNGLQLPGHAWRGYLQALQGKAIAGNRKQVFALQHSLGSGKVVWLPSLVGLGSRMYGNRALGVFLNAFFQQMKVSTSVAFAGHYPGLQLHTLKAGEGWITISINKSGLKATPKLLLPAGAKPQVLFGKSLAVKPGQITLQPEETLVVYWQ